MPKMPSYISVPLGWSGNHGRLSSVFVVAAGLALVVLLMAAVGDVPALAREVDYGSNPKLFYRNGFKPTPVMPALPEVTQPPKLCDGQDTVSGFSLEAVKAEIQQWANGVGLTHLTPEVLALWLDEGLVAQPADLYALTPVSVAQLPFTQRVTSRAAIKQIQQQPWVGWPRVLHGMLGNILTEPAIELMVEAFPSPYQLNKAMVAEVAETLAIHEEAAAPVIAHWCQWQPWLYNLQQAEVLDAALFDEDDPSNKSELPDD